MSEPSTDEVELASLLTRVMSAPLAPLREHGAKLEKDLKAATDKNSSSSQMLHSSLDSINLSQKKVMSKLGELEELLKPIDLIASHLGSLRDTVLSADQLQQSLEIHARDQKMLIEHGQEHVKATLRQQQEHLVELDNRVAQSKNDLWLQLQERLDRSDLQATEGLREHVQVLEDKLLACAQRISNIGSHLAKLQSKALTTEQVQDLLEIQASAQRVLVEQGHKQVQASLRHSRQSVDSLDAQVAQVKTDLRSHFQDRFDLSDQQLGRALDLLGERQDRQLSKSFKWLMTLGVLNLMGLAACAVWIILQR
ncbi:MULTISPECIES: hypothetical protein [Pseudomonas]|uniref:hypothetical protein n=1 Tax=Pseudomonas TaxID=286 RepID=UPI001CD1E116|nr:MULTISPECIES: hypothetical protein [Pseudomonas]MCU1772890.1 hypothetical protein [Pseudomonas sp. 13B_3.2_Bac1]